MLLFWSVQHQLNINYLCKKCNINKQETFDIDKIEKEIKKWYSINISDIKDVKESEKYTKNYKKTQSYSFLY